MIELLPAERAGAVAPWIGGRPERAIASFLVAHQGDICDSRATFGAISSRRQCERVMAYIEVFGPVLAVMAFDNEAEAVRIPNGTPA